LEEGSDLLDAADAEAGDLEHLVGAVVSVSDDDQIWSEEILDRWPEATEAALAILVRTVHITPVMRGHRLGASAADKASRTSTETVPWWLFRPPPLRGVTSGSCASMTMPSSPSGRQPRGNRNNAASPITGRPTSA